MSVNGLEHPDTSFHPILALSVTYTLYFELRLWKPWSKVLPSGSKEMFSCCFEKWNTATKISPFSLHPEENYVLGEKLKLLINSVIYSFPFVTRTFLHNVNLVSYSLFMSLVDETCSKTIWNERCNHLTGPFLSLLSFAWFNLGNRDCPSSLAHQSSHSLWSGSAILQLLSQQPHGTERQYWPLC